MSGFAHDANNNELVYTSNVDFSGGATPTGQVLLNSQLLIGSTALPHIQVGKLISPNNTIVFGYSSPNITVQMPQMNDGQIIIGSTAGSPIATTLTAGAGITITNASNSITIAVADQGFTWNNITATSANMVKENGYEANNAGQVTLTLPTTASSTFGDRIAVMGLGAGGWKIAQLAGQQIQFGSLGSTVGVGGSISSNNQWSNVEIVYSTTSGLWIVMSSIGNITVT